MKSLIKTGISIVLLISMLAGCSFGAGSESDKDKKASIKVMFHSEDYFFQEYGMLFSALYPNIEINVVSTQSLYMTDNSGSEPIDYEKAMQEFIEKEQPDVLMLNTQQYKTMAAEGKLYDLDSAIKKNKYNTETLIPGMVDYLKELSGGQLFALTPNFYSQVLYYNKDIFDKYQIKYPTDRMSWNEVLQLARLFPTEGEPQDRVYGLKVGYSDRLFELASSLASAEGITFVNPAKKEMTINSDSWKNAVQTALDAINSNSLYFEEQHQNMSFDSNNYEHYFLRDPFISGRLAMALGDNYVMSQMKQAKDNVKDKTKIVANWDMVTVPVSQQNPDQSTYMSFNNLFAISEQSPNKDAAWQLISYITGEEFARVKSMSGYNNGFPVRTNYIKDEEGRNFAAFYSLKPSSFDMYKDYDKLPQNFWGDFNTAIEEAFTPLKEGTVTIDETLEKLQLKGQELLLRADDTPNEEGAQAGGSAGGVVESTEVMVETNE